jgi:hypothetical protein
MDKTLIMYLELATEVVLELTFMALNKDEQRLATEKKYLEK